MVLCWPRPLVYVDSPLAIRGGTQEGMGVRVVERLRPKPSDRGQAVRLVQTPCDAAVFVDVDAVTAMRTIPEGTEGVVSIPTSHGVGEVGITIPDRWRLELQAGVEAVTWQRCSELEEARAEMRRLSDAIWSRRRFHG